MSERFERATLPGISPEDAREMLTFIFVGAGPTGAPHGPPNARRGAVCRRAGRAAHARGLMRRQAWSWRRSCTTR